MAQSVNQNFPKIRKIAQSYCIKYSQKPLHDPVMPLDYSGQNLRGRSFKGQNLTGANFSGADIRGADFTNAILKDADFRGAKAGLQRRWVIGLLIVSWLLAIISGYLTCMISVLPVYFTETEIKNPQNLFTSIICLIVVAGFFIIAIRKGFTKGLGVSILFLSLIVASVFITFFIYNNALSLISLKPIVLSFLFVVPIVVAIAITFSFSLAFITASVFIFAGYIAYRITWFLASFLILSLATSGNLVIGVIALLSELGIYIGLDSVTIGYRKHTFIRSFAIAFAATGGTSFRSADLTDADFTSATLKSTDFRRAKLIRTRFYESEYLYFARVGNSILSNLSVLFLLLTGDGRKKSYVSANLKGANLIGADLKKANLKGTDISEATFQGACLEWANLTRTQAIDTDFTSAQMTGACVEAWNIESTTKLDNVDCRFIYLLEKAKPGTDDLERRPSSGEFQPGEFTKLFEEVLNTVDLIFRNGIDWKAFVAAFKKVQVENEDTELVIQSIENKGDGVIVVKVNVPFNADKEKIHSDFIQNYQLALQAVEEKYKAQLQAKDEQIEEHRQKYADMKEIVGLLASKPVNVQVDNKLENKNMTNSNDASRKIEIGSVGRDFNASGQALNLGEIDISGVVTNTINQLPESPEPEKPGIKELLTQLQEAIEADTNLTEEDKAEALEQVKALAEAGKNPQEGAMQKAAKTAIKILKGTVAGLPSAATLVEACSKLLPLISKSLGLG